jgi:predicted metallopeptidase
MMVILDERRRWLYPTIECVLLEYKEKRRPLTKEDIGSCLKEKGVRSSDTLTNNIYVAHDFGYLYDLGDNKDVKRSIELGYRDLKRIHGRGKLIPTVLALVDLAIYNIIHETLKELNISDDEVIKSILHELVDEVSSAMDDALDAISDALGEMYIDELKRLGYITYSRVNEIIVKMSVPEESWHFECKGKREDLEEILNCIDKKLRDMPRSVREKLMQPEWVWALIYMVNRFRDALNGKVHPMHPSLIDHYMGFMMILIELAKYRLHQEQEMREKVHKEVKELVKKMFSEEKKT